MQRTFGWSAAVATLLLMVALAGCTPSSSVNVDPTVGPGNGDYYRGVATQWSVPLAELGDATQLEDDSSMRHALVAGDATFFIATSAFREDDTVALDLIVVNHRPTSVRVAAADIHVFDASGRALSAKRRAPRAAARGLQGRHFGETAPSTLSQDFGDQSFQSDLALTQLQSAVEGVAKGPSAVASPRKRPLDSTNISGLQTTRPTVDTVVSSVNVDPDEGRPFWAYFEAGDLQYPLTAWITLETGEQLRYQFDR